MESRSIVGFPTITLEQKLQVTMLADYKFRKESSLKNIPDEIQDYLNPRCSCAETTKDIDHLSINQQEFEGCIFGARTKEAQEQIDKLLSTEKLEQSEDGENKQDDLKKIIDKDILN